MGYLSEIGQLAQRAEVGLGLREPKSAQLPHDDSETFGSEILRQYEYVAKKLGVNMMDTNLWNAIYGYTYNLESGFLCLLEYEDKLEDGVHATNFLCKALNEGWKPKKFHSYSQAKRAIPWL